MRFYDWCEKCDGDGCYICNHTGYQRDCDAEDRYADYRYEQARDYD